MQCSMESVSAKRHEEMTWAKNSSGRPTVHAINATKPGVKSLFSPEKKRTSTLLVLTPSAQIACLATDKAGRKSKLN